MTKVVALTGGIGCGKSTVSAQFAELGIGVLDTDQVAHELTSPNQPTVFEIADSLGPGLVDASGSLNRPKLRELVFRDSSARARLEAILHPQIRSRTSAFVASATGPYCMVVVPLLFEKLAYRDLVGHVIAIDCRVGTQLARVSARPGLTEEQARLIVAAQCPRAVRLQLANDVISNDGGLDHLVLRVSELHQRFVIG